VIDFEKVERISVGLFGNFGCGGRGGGQKVKGKKEDGARWVCLAPASGWGALGRFGGVWRAVGNATAKAAEDIGELSRAGEGRREGRGMRDGFVRGMGACLLYNVRCCAVGPRFMR